ncbi:hypothetical protein BDV33DRAFT_211008 [Aspergillus novoparasiticus]|uniref:Methyltransferase domain-containing protein n=1 Tax=Aspergillus novoparasiticus TaxID=986946 RepID=A0A5N6E7C8_9EURO|nr:hypothetical protein BDV33DRAFT_211008 [Aspergillus novoparasiticus]
MESLLDDGYDSGVEFDDDLFIPLESPDEGYHNNGRLYPASQRSRHPFPIDEREKERQHRQFLSYCELFDGKLCLASIKRPQTVFDVRTGTGSWAMQFADEYPSSTVYGIDAVYMQEEWTPINCEFLIDDLTQRDWYDGLPRPELIHIGGLCGDRQVLTCLLDGAYRYDFVFEGRRLC